MVEREGGSSARKPAWCDVIVFATSSSGTHIIIIKQTGLKQSFSFLVLDVVEPHKAR